MAASPAHRCRRAVVPQVQRSAGTAAGSAVTRPTASLGALAVNAARVWSSRVWAGPHTSRGAVMCCQDQENPNVLALRITRPARVRVNSVFREICGTIEFPDLSFGVLRA